MEVILILREVLPVLDNVRLTVLISLTYYHSAECMLGIACTNAILSKLLNEVFVFSDLQTIYKRFSKGGLKFATTTKISLWNNSVWLFCAIFLSSRYASVSLGKGSTCLTFFFCLLHNVVRLECVE